MRKVRSLDERLSKLMTKAESVHETEVPKAVDDILRYFNTHPKILLDFTREIKRELDWKSSEAIRIDDVKYVRRFMEMPDNKGPNEGGKPIDYEFALFRAITMRIKKEREDLEYSAYLVIKAKYSDVTFDAAVNKVVDSIINNHKEWKVLGSNTLGRLST